MWNAELDSHIFLVKKQTLSDLAEKTYEHTFYTINHLLILHKLSIIFLASWILSLLSQWHQDTSWILSSILSRTGPQSHCPKDRGCLLETSCIISSIFSRTGPQFHCPKDKDWLLETSWIISSIFSSFSSCSRLIVSLVSLDWSNKVAICDKLV